jgi:hypothetical protein
MTFKEYSIKIKNKLIDGGHYPVQAIYDISGNCVICGEAGRCPGWHTKEEIKPVPCGYETKIGFCNYPGISGKRPCKCADCNSGTTQNIIAIASSNEGSIDHATKLY